MSNIHGVWRNETAFMGSTIVVTQDLRPDGSYETHMIFPVGGGEQHIHHYGQAAIGAAAMKLIFESGKTRVEGCEDAAKNFALRDFTASEIEDAVKLLDQDIPYTLDADVLTTKVDGPMGQMTVVYQRVS